MNSSKKLRRSRVQTAFDPYELPLFSDSSCDEFSEDESGNDPTQQDAKRYKLILDPHLPMNHSPEFEDPNSRKRGMKRKRSSNHIRPLSDYLYYKKRNSDSKSHGLPSDCLENHGSISQPNSDRNDKSQERRVPNIWDAQAGRLTFEGFIQKSPRYPDDRDRPSMRMNPILSDVSVRHDARVQYADHLSEDFSTPDPNLPRWELVKALYEYASGYYAHVIPGGGEIDNCSMDVSALLAIAKLLEASVETVIGETGDLAFTEGASFEETGGLTRFYPGVGSWGPSVLEKKTFDYWELLNSQRELTEIGLADKKARLARSGSRGASGQRKSCVLCNKQKKLCDRGRPCARCIAINRVDHCIYESDSGISRSRSRGRRSCRPCYQQKRACDHGHPCARCIKSSREDKCIYDSDSQDEEMNSKLSLSRPVSSNSSGRSNVQISDSDNSEEEHSNIGVDEEESGSEDGEVNAEAIALAMRGRPVTRSSSENHSVSQGRTSKRSWSGRVPPTFRLQSEENSEMDVDDLNSDGDLESTCHRRDLRIEGASRNVERDMSQPSPDLSGGQLGVEHGSSLATFESDEMGSDSEESDSEEALLFDDSLDSSSESDSSKRESQFHVHRSANGKDAPMGDSENESELRDEDYSSFSGDDKGTSTGKV